LGRTMVWWDQSQSVEQKREFKRQSMTATDRKGASVPDL
jgi:hypothetical protein